MMGYNPDVAKALDQMMHDFPEARPGKMFGMPAYKINGKLAVGLHHDEVLAKVGVERTKALIGKPGIQACKMGDRVWKDWVTLSGDLNQQRAVIEEAVHYVATNS